MQPPPIDRRATAPFSADRQVLQPIVAVLFLVAAVWLVYQFWRLLLQHPPEGAMDLRQRYDELHAWFSGERVYGRIFTSVYPPASYILLWPMLAWPSFLLVRWIWAVTAILSLIWLIRISWREIPAAGRLERALLAIIPLSLYATGATIGNGQLLVHLVPMLLASFVLMRDRDSLIADMGASALFVLTLIKPSATAPFFLVVLAMQKWRAAAMIIGGYLLCTVWAAAYQPAGPIDLLYDWFNRAEVGVAWGNERGGYLNQGSWLMEIGQSDWSSIVALASLAGLSIWMYIHRRVELWLLLGVTSVVARFWTYHPWYDDLLLLLPLFAIYRLGRSESVARRGAYVLAACLLLSLIAPGGLYTLPDPWKSVYVGFQLVVWVAALVLLFHHAWIRRTVLTTTA